VGTLLLLIALLAFPFSIREKFLVIKRLCVYLCLWKLESTPGWNPNGMWFLVDWTDMTYFYIPRQINRSFFITWSVQNLVFPINKWLVGYFKLFLKVKLYNMLKHNQIMILKDILQLRDYRGAIWIKRHISAINLYQSTSLTSLFTSEQINTNFRQGGGWIGYLSTNLYASLAIFVCHVFSRWRHFAHMNMTYW